MTSSVSIENIMKVEGYFIKQVRNTGDKRIEVTVHDIADGSNVALATAHRALIELIGRGVLNIIKPSSRRFPTVYIYNGDVEEFEITQSKDDQIKYLRKIIFDKDKEIRELLERISSLERIVNGQS